MKQIIRSRISRKFLALAFLILGLLFTASTKFTTQTVTAGYECCEDCLPAYVLCREFCDDPQTSYPGCATVCINSYNSCRNYCSRCS